LGFCFGFELLLLFSLFCHFSCFLLAFMIFLLLDDFLSFSLAFDHLVVLHGSWIQTLNFLFFVINGLIKGEIEKPSDQFLGLSVMSH
jgi:hypothetical protein